MVLKLKKVVSVVAVLVAIFACAAFVLSTLSQADSRDRVRAYLGDVDPRDGISEDESRGIAVAYFQGYIGACGGPDEPKLVGNEWVFPIQEGYGGTTSPFQLRIDAGSGAISYPDGPSFMGYNSFRFIVLWGMPVVDFYRYVDKLIEELRWTYLGHGR